jgi:hypothetical protein
MLATAAQDVAHAAGYALPQNVADLPADLRFAIIDQATRLYDARGADEIRPGLSAAASRIVHRYRGVTLGAPEHLEEPVRYCLQGLIGGVAAVPRRAFAVFRPVIGSLIGRSSAA